MRIIGFGLILFVSCTLASCVGLRNLELEYQRDADLIRLEHLQYWTSLIEKYYTQVGHYPLQDMIEDEEGIILVKIATKSQSQYLSKGNLLYNPRLDNNPQEVFKEVSVKSLVQELEDGLGTPIAEKYDIQKVPTESIIGYNYFVTRDGYLFWSTCITCGVTEISTLLMNGFTPTVNIVSEGMVGKVTKALTRDEMVSHKIFQSWIKESLTREEYVRGLVEENESDSKK